jgi:hypothetical protein
LKATKITAIVALAIVAAALSSAATGAPTEQVAVLVVPASDPVFRDPEAAQGVLVPGGGSTVSRRSARASLVRGKMGNAVVHGGVPTGAPKITLGSRPGRTTFYVALPPPGRHHNVTRYPIAVVGPGYRGLLTSTATRLPGLISIADVASSVKALRSGDEPRIRSKPSADPAARLAELDRRLGQAHDARNWATLVLVGLLTALGLLALGTRSAALARAAFLSPASCVAAAVALSALDVRTPWTAVLGVALLGGGAALGAGLLLPPRLPMALALAALFAFLFTVMWARPEWNTLAVIGPHPDGGGRFFGITNEVETILLAPALALGALAGPALVPVVGLLVAAGVAASEVGADGGGLVVYLAGFLVLWLRLRRVPATQAVAATAVSAAAALLLVGIDAATGGSSHVTHAVGGGPGSLLGDLGHRLHLSGASLVSSWNAALLFSLSICALVWLGLRRPRLAVLDALLAALVVSLLVNDTPADVAGFGALSALLLWVWARSEERNFPLQ